MQPYREPTIITVRVVKMARTMYVRADRNLAHPKTIAAAQAWWDRYARKHGMEAGTVRVTSMGGGSFQRRVNVIDRRGHLLHLRGKVGFTMILTVCPWVEAMPQGRWGREIIDQYPVLRYIAVE